MTPKVSAIKKDTRKYLETFKVSSEDVKKYLQRFEGTEPLICCGDYRIRTFTFIESDINVRNVSGELQNIDLNKQYKILAAVKKTKLKDFIHFDCLSHEGEDISAEELPDLFNKRVVEKMQKLCPNDFIALPVTLINLSNRGEFYENKDFYIVNPLNTVKAIDEGKSRTIYEHSLGKEIMTKRIYKENPWQGHLIAWDNITSTVIYHPKLAKELFPSKWLNFVTPEEDSYWHAGGLPEGYDNQTWFSRTIVSQKIAHPNRQVLKLINESLNDSPPKRGNFFKNII